MTVKTIDVADRIFVGSDRVAGFTPAVNDENLGHVRRSRAHLATSQHRRICIGGWMIVGDDALNREQVVAAPEVGHTVPATPLPSMPPNATPTGSRSALARLAIPLLARLASLGFIALGTLRWDGWVGSATIQTTNNAYVRAELTRLSSRVAGEVVTVAANDFQRVKADDLLVQIRIPNIIVHRLVTRAD